MWKYVVYTYMKIAIDSIVYNVSLNKASLTILSISDRNIKATIYQVIIIVTI